MSYLWKKISANVLFYLKNFKEIMIKKIKI